MFVATRFETNKSLGLELRSELGRGRGTATRQLHSRAERRSARVSAFNDERGVDVESTRNIEGVLTFRTVYYTYDRPRTTLDVALQDDPSLSNLGRQRGTAQCRRKA